MSVEKNEKYKRFVIEAKKKTASFLVEELQKEFDSLSPGDLIDTDLFKGYMSVVDELDPIDDTLIDPLAIFKKVQEQHPELFQS